jgi:hypothetical protein
MGSGYADYVHDGRESPSEKARRHEDLQVMAPYTSNQSVELTATRRARPFIMTRTFSLQALPALGGGSSLLSR